MKKIILLLMLVPVLSQAQQYSRFDIKNIEVFGNAEREITPNEIYTVITLKEYKDKKVSLDDLEKQLVKAVAAEGISKKNLKVENVSGYNWDWKKKRSAEFLASKSFELKTEDAKKLNDLLGALDPEGLHHVYIKKYTHSDIDKFKSELQLEALRDAKEKAQKLVKGIGEDLGGVLEIQEINDGGPHIYRQEAMMNMRSKASSDSYQSDVEFQDMTISVTIRAVFKIE